MIKALGFALLLTVAGTAEAGWIVITTPSGESTIVETQGVASHVTSNYSAQIDSVIVAQGQHGIVTPESTHTATSRGTTATLTVVTK